MRIAIFSEVYWPMVSGVALTLRRTAGALRQRGHRVRIYTATYPAAPGAEPDPDTHQSPSGPLLLSPQVQWGAPHQPEITRDLRDFGPDVVHLATEFPMGLAGLRAARRIGAPVVASAHTDYARYARHYGLSWAAAPGWAYLQWFYRHANRVLAPTRAFAASLRERGIPHAGIWSRGVDTDEFAPRHRSFAYRRALGLPDDALIVSYVGRLAPEKGIDTLLAAWPVISTLHPRAHLVFTGSGPAEATIRRAALNRVHLTGARHGRALAEAYATADLFVMPSETETFGNVTLEAMASGVPVVAMAAGGILDFGTHREDAWLVDPRQPAAFCTAVDRLLADWALRHRLGRAARLTALSRAWGPVMDGLVDHYRQAAGCGAPHRRVA